MITLAGVAHAQRSVTLYGLIDASLTYTNNQVTAAGRVIDIVSHANLVHGLASVPDEPVSDATLSYAEIRAVQMGELAERIQISHHKKFAALPKIFLCNMGS
ncbi:hypothetical protein LMG28727_01361 [Paraburkholderia kirstenboschensis]|nr:hypothetical protein LMG28727_01361 [Paraburkholderia kirstenboschensis]